MKLELKFNKLPRAAGDELPPLGKPLIVMGFTKERNVFLREAICTCRVYAVRFSEYTGTEQGEHRVFFDVTDAMPLEWTVTQWAIKPVEPREESRKDCQCGPSA